MFREYIKLPLHHDVDTGLYVRDADNHIVGMVISNGGVRTTDMIVTVLNGDGDQNTFEKWKYLRPGESFGDLQKATKPKVVSTSGTQIILRGWGMLTGIGDGCYNLQPAIAAEAQDSFGEYIERKLNHE